jgi:hypothetical protein
MRPDHFEDAALISSPDHRGVTFTVKVDLLGNLGPELYAYLLSILSACRHKSSRSSPPSAE